jgi:hypothetical protein
MRLRRLLDLKFRNNLCFPVAGNLVLLCETLFTNCYYSGGKGVHTRAKIYGRVKRISKRSWLTIISYAASINMSPTVFDDEWLGMIA